MQFSKNVRLLATAAAFGLYNADKAQGQNYIFPPNNGTSANGTCPTQMPSTQYLAQYGAQAERQPDGSVVYPITPWQPVTPWKPLEGNLPTTRPPAISNSQDSNSNYEGNWRSVNPAVPPPQPIDPQANNSTVQKQAYNRGDDDPLKSTVASLEAVVDTQAKELRKIERELQALHTQLKTQAQLNATPKQLDELRENVNNNINRIYQEIGDLGNRQNQFLIRLDEIEKHLAELAGNKVEEQTTKDDSTKEQQEVQPVTRPIPEVDSAIQPTEHSLQAIRDFFKSTPGVILATIVGTHFLSSIWRRLSRRS